ncbi:MAG: hypothetical protein Kow00122_21520 [Thermoleophilia bacterium]
MSADRRSRLTPGRLQERDRAGVSVRRSRFFDQEITKPDPESERALREAGYGEEPYLTHRPVGTGSDHPHAPSRAEGDEQTKEAA